jgi:putative ABC transport system permease protein
MAVGAGTPDILQMILCEGFKIAAIGSALGLLIALPLPRLLDSVFQGIHFEAPALHVIALAAILIVSAFAIYIPALRATHVDPKTALRDQ